MRSSFNTLYYYLLAGNTVKIAYFIKRQDVCFYLRVFIPSTHLNMIGHETREVLVEHQLICRNPNCKNKGIQELRSDFNGDVYSCPTCFTPLKGEINEWKKSIYDAVDWCDVAVFQRNTDKNSLDLLIECKKRGKFTVIESDDNYIDIPDHNNGAKYYRERKHILEEMFRIADGHTVTTKGLKDFYLRYNKNIQIIPNAFDIEVYDVTPPTQSVYVFNGRNNQISLDQFNHMREGKKFVCWAGSPTHEKDLDIIIDVLDKAIKKENIIVGMCAFVHRRMLELYPENRLFLFGLIPAGGWYSMMQFLKPDVWLGPVEKNEFNKGKSNLKFQEAALMGSMFVGTNFDTYNQSELIGELVENDPSSWWFGLRRAINKNPEERDQINQHNRQILLRDFDIKQTVKVWDSFFKTGVSSEV